MIEILLYVLGVLILLVGLAVSIGLHEIGHLLPAKLFGVKVTQYMIGFGRTLWSRKKGETEYGVKMIPLGGYISMIGMFPPQKPGEAPRESSTGFLDQVVREAVPAKQATAGADGADSVGADPASTDPARTDAAGTDPARTDPDIGTGAADRADDPDTAAGRGIAGFVDEARQASAETISAGEDHRAFYRLPVWKKIVVMLGGPLMNLVLAFVFFGIVLVGFGVPQDSTTLGSVNECLKPASSSSAECESEDPAAPAAAAGLRPGDRIVAVEGETIESWAQFRALVGEAPNRALDVRIERDGAEETVQLTPVANERVVVDRHGRAVVDGSGSPETERVGMVGATAASETVQQPITEVPVYVGENVQAVANVIIRLPQRMVDVWNAAFGAEERDPNGPIGVVGVGRIAGEIASMDEAPIAARAQTMFGLLGSLNVALFVFNLIPLMPLDGGHVAGALYEGAKRGIARLRGRPDPGPVDTARMAPVTFAVAIVLGGMMLLLVYADLVKPVNLFG